MFSLALWFLISFLITTSMLLYEPCLWAVQRFTECKIYLYSLNWSCFVSIANVADPLFHPGPGAGLALAWLLMSDNTASVHTLGSCPPTASTGVSGPWSPAGASGAGRRRPGTAGAGPSLALALVCGVINGWLSEVTQTRHTPSPHCTALHQPQHRSEANPTALPGSTKWRPSYTDHGDSRALTHRAHTSRGGTVMGLLVLGIEKLCSWRHVTLFSVSWIKCVSISAHLPIISLCWVRSARCGVSARGKGRNRKAAAGGRAAVWSSPGKLRGLAAAGRHGPPGAPLRPRPPRPHPAPRTRWLVIITHQFYNGTANGL